MPTVYIVMVRRDDQASVVHPILRLPEMPCVGALVSVPTYGGTASCRVRSTQPYEPPHRLSCGTQIDAAIIVESMGGDVR
jgi:hypothetical protein